MRREEKEVASIPARQKRTEKGREQYRYLMKRGQKSGDLVISAIQEGKILPAYLPYRRRRGAAKKKKKKGAGHPGPLGAQKGTKRKEKRRGGPVGRGEKAR